MCLTALGALGCIVNREHAPPFEHLPGKARIDPRVVSELSGGSQSESRQQILERIAVEAAEMATPVVAATAHLARQLSSTSILLIRDGDDDAVTSNPSELGTRFVVDRFGEMFEDFTGGDHIDRSIGEGEAISRRLDSVQFEVTKRRGTPIESDDRGLVIQAGGERGEHSAITGTDVEKGGERRREQIAQLEGTDSGSLAVEIVV